MKKINKFIVLATSLLLFSSCSDWLDVKSDTEEREKDIFTSYKGYKEALAGCYTSMADRNIYGEKLTMSDIECMAALWEKPTESTQPAFFYLHNHDYTQDESRKEIDAIYSGLYNVIVQTNAIINNINANPASIQTEQGRNVIEGEAHAMRAFCHFDVLRMFGQMPENAQKTVSLPYSETNDIRVMPPYYSYSDFTKKIESDLNKAEELLEKSDPILSYSFTQLSSTDSESANLADDFLMYRRNRINYWAVKAIKARFYLYIGEKEKAYNQAKAIIDAKLGSKPVIELSGNEDYAKGYNALPSESLFALQTSKLIDYSISVLGGNIAATLNSTQLHLTTRMLDNSLYLNQNTTSNNRYLYAWEHNTISNSTKTPTLKKYFYNTSASYTYNEQLTCLQIIPLVRLSEIYLIAMESTQDLTEANNLYRVYMKSHNVNVTTDFTSLQDLDAEILNEYRREFYGEGEMFFTYKRKAVSEMMFNAEPMGENQYIVPLPETEYNPNGK